MPGYLSVPHVPVAVDVVDVAIKGLIQMTLDDSHHTMGGVLGV